LPILAAAPFGGVLGGDAVLVAPAPEGSAFDLALAGLLGNPPEADQPPIEDDAADLIPISDEDALPLLAASRARVDSARAEPDLAPAPIETSFLVEVSEAPAARRGGLLRMAAVRRAIVPVGLGLLATLATTFRLTDPIGPDRGARSRRPLPIGLRRWLRERTRGG
jgi:hypothetical protein